MARSLQIILGSIGVQVGRIARLYIVTGWSHSACEIADAGDVRPDYLVSTICTSEHVSHCREPYPFGISTKDLLTESVSLPHTSLHSATHRTQIAPPTRIGN